MPSSDTRGDIQTEFDLEAFETEVTETVIEAITASIRRLRDQIDDDILEGIFTSDPGSYVLKSEYSLDRLDPEPITQNRVIEPLLDVLGYEEYGFEAGDFSSTRGEQADYAVSLRDIPSIESSRLLIEAEPLQNRGHGIEQVKSWLSQREFESDYGFATDGIRWIFVRYDADSYTHNIISEVDLQPVFHTLFENETTGSSPPTEVIGDEGRTRIAKLVQTFSSDNFRAIVDDAQEVIKRKQEAITDGVAEDEDERRARSLVGDGVVPPSDASGDDTRLFSVDLMNRLIFIKFLEDKQLVRPDLLRTIVDTYDDGVYPQSMYKSFFDPLFYEVFNVKPDARSN